jgi:hypothetical protein
MDDRRLVEKIGPLPRTDLRVALARAIAFFKDIQEGESA